jgi:hypothetical protein
VNKGTKFKVLSWHHERNEWGIVAPLDIDCSETKQPFAIALKDLHPPVLVSLMSAAYAHGMMIGR